MDYIETTPDDEELRQVVNEFVEQVSVSIQKEITNEVNDIVTTFRQTIEYYFPILITYQQEDGMLRLQEDLQKCLLFFILWLLAIVVLSPRLGRRAPPRPKTLSSGNSRIQDEPQTCDTSESEKIASSLDEYENAEDNQEEYFEFLWDTSIRAAAYSKLVLPPSCRCLLRTNYNLSTYAAARRPPNATSEPPEAGREDDNPAVRLQSYLREIWIFVRSLLSFDYSTAGKTLFTWIYNLHRIHVMQRNAPATQEAEPSADSKDAVPNEEKKEEDHSTTNPCGPADLPDASDRQLFTIPQSPLNDVPVSDGLQSSHSTLENEPSPQPPLHLSNNTAALLPQQLTGDGSWVLRIKEPGPADETAAVWMGDSAVIPGGVEPIGTNAPERGNLQRYTSVDSHRHYFDTLTSNDSLKKMSIDIPVPDKHGYILGDEFLMDPLRCTPLLVFVNSRSGPQQGHLLITQLRRLLNPVQIWDLAHGSPRVILESFMVFTRLRILVCGGDGTVSWIIQTLEEMKISQRQYPPIAILPLGTGNDLSRILGWGGGYNNESLIVILEQISESYISLLDRWEVTIDENHKKSKHSNQVKGFFNYLGVGADAQAALQVHNLRESRPQWFFSRIVNKAMYGIFGAEDILKATTIHVRKDIVLIADGIEVPLPHDSQGIILLNIDSYAGGVPLWSHGVPVSVPSNVMNGWCSDSCLDVDARTRPRDRGAQPSFVNASPMARADSVDDLHSLIAMSPEERFEKVTACNMPSSCQDGYLDIVSIRGAFHLGQIKVGLSNAQRLCQCREVTIVLKNKVAVQVDGEPWRQNACTLTIRRKPDHAVMLHRSVDDGGVETEMSKLLDWAETRKIIDGPTHSILMKEFSRRIESLTRQRRAAARQQQHESKFLHFTSSLKKAMSSGAISIS
jgi:diacylglycerol kinase (ATP)